MDFWNGRDFSRNYGGNGYNDTSSGYESAGNGYGDSSGSGCAFGGACGTGAGRSGAAYGDNSADARQDFEKKFEQYKDKSQDELMSELMRVASKMRADGTFDKQALENFYNSAQSFLNPEQRQRMRSLIDMLG